MVVPLYLKFKSNFETESENGKFKLDGNKLLYKEREYEFHKVIKSIQDIESSDDLGVSIPYFIFAGPSGSGKTSTLKQLLHHKLASIKKSKPIFISAFEVANNKYATDLLEDDPTLMRKHFSIINHQQLNNLSTKKCKIDSEETKNIIVSEIFRKRSTYVTNSNADSSRSCLIVNFVENGQRTVYVDLMGNERIEKSFPVDNSFANTNVSSITSFLGLSTSKSQLSSSGLLKSNNFITNLIFNQSAEKKIHVILNIDQNGDEKLNNSSLRNLAQMLQFQKQNAPEDVDVSFSSSSPLTSPIKKVPSLQPNYTRPTLSSLSPERLKSSNFAERKPLKITKVRSETRRSASIGKRTVSSTSSFVKPNVGYIKKQEKRLSDRERKLEIENERLKYENEKLNNEKEQIIANANQRLDQLTNEKSLVEKDIQDLKHNRELEFIEKNSLIEENSELSSKCQTLKEDNNILKAQWKELRIDFQNFQNEHDSFTKLVDSLNVNFNKIKNENKLLLSHKDELSTKTEIVRETKEEIKVLHITLETTVETYEKSIVDLNKQIESKNANELNLTNQLIKTKEKLDEYNCELHKIRSKEEENGVELNVLKSRNAQISAEHQTAKQELESAKLQLEQVDELLFKLNYTTGELENANSTILREKQNKLKLEEEMIKLRRELAESNAEKEDLRIQLKHNSCSISEISSESLSTKSSDLLPISLSAVQPNYIMPDSDSISAKSFQFSFSPPKDTIPSIDFLDQFTSLSEPIFQPQVYEDPTNSILESIHDVGIDENNVCDETENGNVNANENRNHLYNANNISSAKGILQELKKENLLPNPLESKKRLGSHFHYPPAKSSKLRNIVYG